MDEIKRIHLVSGPRNISTALMYSFAQRKDTIVVDEPFYGYYLKHTHVDHPGKEETMNSMSCDPDEVLEKVIFGNYNSQNVFFKNMAKHLVDLDLSFLGQLTNIFLIRHPANLISSFSKVIPDMKEEDIGLIDEWKIFNELIEKGQDPVVIDGSEMLKDPPVMMEKFCEKLEIPFDDKMLHWNPGPRSEDGTWAKYWYHNVHESDGLKKKIEMVSYVPYHLQDLLEEVLPYYQKLFDHALKYE